MNIASLVTPSKAVSKRDTFGVHWMNEKVPNLCAIRFAPQGTTINMFATMVCGFITRSQNNVLGGCARVNSKPPGYIFYLPVPFLGYVGCPFLFGLKQGRGRHPFHTQSHTVETSAHHPVHGFETRPCDKIPVTRMLYQPV